MGVKAMGWAYDQRLGDAVKKAVLVAIANIADDQGFCWPSVARIAAMAEVHPRTVQRHLRELEAMNLLEVQRDRTRNNGSSTSNGYRLPILARQLFDDTTAPRQRATPRQGVTPGDAPPMALDREGGGTGVTPYELSLEPVSTSLRARTRDSEKGTPIPDGFVLSEAVRKWALKRGFAPFLELHFEWFVDYAKAGDRESGKPILARDWDAKLRTAIASDWGDVRRNAQRAEFKPGMKPPNGAARPGEPWYITWTGIQNEGVRRDIQRLSEEGDADYANRILAAAGVTREQAAKDRAEWRGANG